jgi:asparagine synthase (glutamine-hydrolysing)
MCGIAGEWNWRDGRPSLDVTAAMIGAIAHRGPEGQTCWLSTDGKLALAHAQLSFFKGAETQPVSNQRGTVFAVCNGEIYNYRELTGLVRQSGIDCDVRADVQVIPYLYELRGPAGFALLRGEFAFALFDTAKQSLYLVRDRFGIKPIYYHAASGAAAFASEIKALFAHPRVPRAFDRDSLATSLFGLTFPGATAFAGIRAVKPGCYVEINGNGVAEKSYWSLRLAPGGSRLDEAALTEDFLGRFDEAVRLRLHGDYPIGAYLSGGIDSSAVVASMVRSGARASKAFTIGFDDKQLDERQAAIDTTKQLGMDHVIVPVRDSDITANFLNSIWQSEIPVINTHGTAKFLLSRAARGHVKAVMTGEGADELFAGYSYFSASATIAATAATGQRPGLRERFTRWWRLFGSRQFVSGFLAVPREKDINRLQHIFGCVPYLGLRSLFYGRFIRGQLSRDFLQHYSPLNVLAALAEELRPVGFGAMPQVNIDRHMALAYDLPAYQLNFLADRQEMAHAIEGRLPFLDNEVAAFAAALPSEALTGAWAEKSLIRRAFAQRLPARAVNAQKKIFLSPPTSVDDMLRSDFAHHLLSPEVTKAAGVFDWRKLATLKAGLKLLPARSGLGTSLRAAMTLVLSVQALHHIFIACGSRN